MESELECWAATSESAHGLHTKELTIKDVKRVGWTKDAQTKENKYGKKNLYPAKKKKSNKNFYLPYLIYHDVRYLLASEQEAKCLCHDLLVTAGAEFLPSFQC